MSTLSGFFIFFYLILYFIYLQYNLHTVKLSLYIIYFPPPQPPDHPFLQINREIRSFVFFFLVKKLLNSLSKEKDSTELTVVELDSKSEESIVLVIISKIITKLIIAI